VRNRETKVMSVSGEKRRSHQREWRGRKEQCCVPINFY